MKKSLFGALLLFVLAACSPRMETVVILSTNDIHAHIEKFPQLAEAVKKCRDTVKNVILVDAGDRWTGNVYCDRAAEPRRPIIDLMNRLRYDVATFGNHEFDAGQAFLGVRTAQCRFPVVCANIVSDTATFPQPAPYAIVERGGRRIRGLGDQLRPQQPSGGARREFRGADLHGRGGCRGRPAVAARRVRRAGRPDPYRDEERPRAGRKGAALRRDRGRAQPRRDERDGRRRAGDADGLHWPVPV